MTESGPVLRWWQQPAAALIVAWGTGPAGLDPATAQQRLSEDGPNEVGRRHDRPVVLRFLARLGHPLVAVLLAASVVAALLGDRASFVLVSVVVLLSVALEFLQEHRAGRAVQALQGRVALMATVWRGGLVCPVPVRELVRGDQVQLAAGSLVPADGRLLEARDLYVNEAALTGEAFPVARRAVESPAPGESALGADGVLLLGSSVVSGTARMLVCATGDATVLGSLAHTLGEDAAPTAFERGTRGFSLLLTRMTVTLVLFVLLAAVLQQRPLLQSLMFAVALAVGLTPELLPMIVSVTLARGAVRLAEQQVIVKRLSAIEDLGAMDVLATDKTGTLTEASIRLERHLDAQGNDSDAVFELAWLNSHFETGLRSGLDEAVLKHRDLPGAADWRKVDEVPFDFERRRVSVLVERGAQRLLIVKGAPEDLIALSVRVSGPEGEAPLDADGRAALLNRVDALGREGLRVLAVAQRRVTVQAGPAGAAARAGPVAASPGGAGPGPGPDPGPEPMTAADEHDLVFAGLLAFADPPKAGAAQALRDLRALGVAVKVITGDGEAVTRHVAEALGLPVRGVLTGAQIARMDAHALRAAVGRCDLYCRVTPEQKQRLVLALKARGHVVGFLGDGINDATALRAADVGVSVAGAVDVAREAADLVLLQHDLAVLRGGVLEGRRTFANVMKYITMATSSNFGNMASMAAAALVVPFLPMLPLQILLNNLLYDLSEAALPLDRVDPAALRSPQRWDVRYIRNFMLVFGGLSSLFDLLTFGLLLGLLKAQESMFQTAWFVESMATQVLVVFVIRTRLPAWRSHPAPALVAAAAATVLAAALMPFSPWAGWFGFVPLPPQVLLALAGLTLTYLLVVEVAKRAFHRSRRFRHRRAGSPAR